VLFHNKNKEIERLKTEIQTIVTMAEQNNKTTKNCFIENLKTVDKYTEYKFWFLIAFCLFI